MCGFFYSIQAVWIARKLRDTRSYLDGRSISNPPNYFIGSATSPNASEPKYQAIRTEKKINAGTQFFQTNLIFDISKFENYLEALDKRNLLNGMHLIAGITLIRSLKGVQFLQNLPGVEVSKKIIDRLSKSKDVKIEAYQLCLELIEKIKRLTGVQGIHFMAIDDPLIVKNLIIDSNLKN